jgi:Mrp family chromosome partitioning ATPase
MLDPGIPALETCRQVFAALALPQDRAPVLGVTSAIRGEGRTTFAGELASTLSRDLDGKVILVEADLEHPSLARRLDIPEGHGFSEVLRGQTQLGAVARQLASRLFVVTAGTAGDDPSRLLRRMLDHSPFDGSEMGADGAIIVDFPPVIGHGYTALIAHKTDAVILVVRAGVTPADVVRDAIGRFGDRPPEGVVLNGTQAVGPDWLEAVGS